MRKIITGLFLSICFIIPSFGQPIYTPPTSSQSASITFTSSGTYIPTNGILGAWVWVVAGGSGGGGGPVCGSSAQCSGGGSAGGSEYIGPIWEPYSVLAPSVTVTVGQGGAGGTFGNPGGFGAKSSFGSLLIAYAGGPGGCGNTTGGSPGGQGPSANTSTGTGVSCVSSGSGGNYSPSGSVGVSGVSGFLAQTYVLGSAGSGTTAAGVCNVAGNFATPLSGGSGGGFNASGVAQPGCNGVPTSYNAIPGAGGGPTGVAGGNGSLQSVTSWPFGPWPLMCGGGGANNPGTGGAGGNGGFPGGGGCGGGGGTVAGGAGGKGAGGEVVILEVP